MAQVLFGSGITNMKGKVAGNYFRSNGVGTSLVTISIPTLQPGQVALSTTAFLTNFWSNGLTDAQRQAWIAQVQAPELSWARSSFYAADSITAMNNFISKNYYLVQCGSEILLQPVVPLFNMGIDAGPLYYDPTVPSLLLHYTLTGPLNPTHIWITASAFAPWGNTSALANKTHILTYVPGSSPIDLVPAYTAKYGSVPMTPLTWVKVRMIPINVPFAQVGKSKYATSLI
jgi:hypothetical protein